MECGLASGQKRKTAAESYRRSRVAGWSWASTLSCGCLGGRQHLLREHLLDRLVQGAHMVCAHVRHLSGSHKECCWAHFSGCNVSEDCYGLVHGRLGLRGCHQHIGLHHSVSQLRLVVLGVDLLEELVSSEQGHGVRILLLSGRGWALTVCRLVGLCSWMDRGREEGRREGGGERGRERGGRREGI